MEHNKWDFFLAHASADTQAAEELYSFLDLTYRVFLDTKSLTPGDDWDFQIAEAQRNSAVTLVLLSARTEIAYYQREEIAAAIDMARQDSQKHRLVPIFLDSHSEKSVPYGLRLKHGLKVLELGGLVSVAAQLITSLQPLLAMSKNDIRRRYNDRVLVNRAVRLVPHSDFHAKGYFGPTNRKYVFIGDYEEQRNRPLSQLLANLWIGDAFEPLESSNIRWLAIIFEVGNLNIRKLDLMPATWKSAFRILTDPRRANCFSATSEEIAALGRPPRDYYSEDQGYWYNQLTIPDRRYTTYGIDYYLESTLGIRWLCFSGTGITEGGSESACIPSRIFFIKNVALATVKYDLQNLGKPDENIFLL